MIEFFSCIPNKQHLCYFHPFSLKQVVSYLCSKTASNSSTNNSITDNIQTGNSVADLCTNGITND